MARRRSSQLQRRRRVELRLATTSRLQMVERQQGLVAGAGEVGPGTLSGPGPAPSMRSPRPIAPARPATPLWNGGAFGWSVSAPPKRRCRERTPARHPADGQRLYRLAQQVRPAPALALAVREQAQRERLVGERRQHMDRVAPRGALKLRRTSDADRDPSAACGCARCRRCRRSAPCCARACPCCQLESPSSGRFSAYCPSTQRVIPSPTNGASIAA